MQIRFGILPGNGSKDIVALDIVDLITFLTWCFLCRFGILVDGSGFNDEESARGLFGLVMSRSLLDWGRAGMLWLLKELGLGFGTFHL